MTTKERNGESKLIQNIKSFLEIYGINPESVKIAEQNGIANVGIGTESLKLRSKDSLKVREEKLKAFVPNNRKMPETPERIFIQIKEGENEFNLIETKRDGKKIWICPCNRSYNQKGHAKWNHIKRHLKVKK